MNSFFNSKSLLALMLSLYVSVHAQAQTKEAFKVLASKGGNTVSESGKTGALPVNLGSKLFDNQTLHLVEGGYISLIHATGRSLELKKAGTFKVSELLTQLGSGGTGMAAKYANFVIGELTKNDVDLNKEHRKNMTVTGSVERSTENSGIMVNVPSSLKVLETPFSIKLLNGDTNKTYSYTLMNMFEDIISTKTFKGDSVNIELPEEITDESALLFITDKYDPKLRSKTISILLPDAKTKESIKQDIQLIEQEIGVQSAVSHLVVATYLEEKKLFLEAERHFQAAIMMDPEVGTYQLAYRQFQERNGLQF